MPLSRVLLIDDDSAFRHAMSKALRRKGVEVVQAVDGEMGIAGLQGQLEAPAQVAVLDLRMPGMDGLEVLRRTLGRRIPVLVLSGHGTVPDAVKAMQLGAFSFLLKPVDGDELFQVLQQAINEPAACPVDLIGESTATRKLRELLRQLATAQDPVLLTGETGTGKEVAAHYLHYHSDRSSRPFVGVNVGGLPSELLESELFGHARGAFTGADRRKRGLFMEAEDGTLFLDEVSELSLEHQVKLLRVIENRSFRPLGDVRDEPLRARLISATNRNLPEALRTGAFRKDLYYRLHVFPVEIPPLRLRRDDILPITAHWLKRLSPRELVIDSDAQRELLNHDYPGNVRELVTAIRRVALFATDDRIDGRLVKRMLAESPFPIRGRGPADPPASPESPDPLIAAVPLRQMEKQHIEKLLREHRNITLVARLLEIDRRTLQRKLKSLEIDYDGRD